MILSKFQYKILLKISKKPYILHSELRQIAKTENEFRRFDDSVNFFLAAGLIKNTLAPDYSTYLRTRADELRAFDSFKPYDPPIVRLFLTESGYAAIESHRHEFFMLWVPVAVSVLSIVLSVAGFIASLIFS